MTADLTQRLAPVSVTEPGVYADIPELNYHADPCDEGSLSHSDAKLLLPPSAPALYKYHREHGRLPKRQFDFGHAAHALVLDVGLDVVVIDADNYRTKAAQDQQKEAHTAGKVPLLRDEWATVQAMAVALRAHPLANALLSTDIGTPEASLFARDPRTGVMLRARLDHLPHPTDGRLIITDYKTTICAEPNAFGRSAATYGYPSQHAWYVDIARALGLAEDVAMVFVAQEKEPPYLVSVVELEPDAIRAGRARNRKAIDTYLQCRTDDHWPGYSDDVELVRVPRWYLYDSEDIAS